MLLGLFAVLTIVAPELDWDDYYVFWYRWFPLITGAYVIITSVLLRARYSCPMALIAAVWLICGLMAIVWYGIHQQVGYSVIGV